MIRWIIGTVIAAACIGCADDSTVKPLPLNTSLGSGSATDARRGPLDDRPGALMYDNVRMELLSPQEQARKRQAPGSEQDNRTGVSDTVRNAVKSPRDEAVLAAGLGTSAATLPAPRQQPVQGVGVGQAIGVGSVVVTVNGEPIFSNEIISSLTPVLSAVAKQLDERRFRLRAREEIDKQVGKMVFDKLEFAVAERNLGPDDKRLAEALTSRDRDDAIRRAGGALALARQQAANQGVDFDEWVKERYRANLRAVYLQRKEFPRIQITADDMRKYYDAHQADLFSSRPQAQFRVIKIGIKQTGDRAKALAKITELRGRLQRGEDFAEIAGAINDDPFLMRSKGDAGGWIDRGAYANQPLEQAVWALYPGQVTGVIEGPDAFYLAKLEQKKEGRTRSFDEEAVQNQIRAALRAEQFEILRTRSRERLTRDAVIVPDPPLLGPVLDLAMQRYPDWAKK